MALCKAKQLILAAGEHMVPDGHLAGYECFDGLDPASQQLAGWPLVHEYGCISTIAAVWVPEPSVTPRPTTEVTRPVASN